MRLPAVLLRACAGALVALGLFGVASGAAHAVTFDFEHFPDSAGCALPTLVSEGPWDCDPDWALDWSAGTVYEHQHTVDGLTLTLTALSNLQGGDNGVDWGWLGPVISCGNTPDCTPYLASFSQALVAVQVDLLGARNTGGTGEEFPDPLTYYLQAYSDANAAGDLLGELVVDASLGPSTLALDAPAGSLIRSITFGAMTVDSGECSGPCQNLGIADNLVATVVPEPGTAGLLALGLGGLSAIRRRFRPCGAESARSGMQPASA